MRTSSQDLGRRRGLLSGIVAGALVLLVLGGAFEIHGAGEGHFPAQHHHEGLFFPAASHPDQPLHVEGATPAERPHCAACVLRVQTSGVQLPAAALAALSVSGDRLALAPSVPPVERHSSRRSGRAPPLS